MAQAKKTLKGPSWADDECQQLREEFSQNLSVKDIANLHRRTPKAIEHRLARFAAEEILNGSDMMTAVSKYHVTESMVEQKVRQLHTEKQPNLKTRIAELENRVSELEKYLADVRV